MLFTEEHIAQIISGEKTQTRRLWDKKQVKKGNSYRACESLFTPRVDSPAYILVLDVYQENLGKLSESDANEEGGYTREEFKELWIDMHGCWNKNDSVWVVKFEGYENDPRQI